MTSPRDSRKRKAHSTTDHPASDTRRRRRISEKAARAPSVPFEEFAIARDPALDRHIHDQENRAADATTNAEATQLLTQAAHLRREAGKAEPGQ